MKIFIAAGTGDGRIIIRHLLEKGMEVTASVTSSYGKSLIDMTDSVTSECLAAGKLHILQKAMDLRAFDEFFLRHPCHLILDATHPYAVKASENLIAAAKSSHISYLRYERSLTDFRLSGLKCYQVHSYEEAAVKAAALGKVVFLTIGSHNLETFVKEPALYDHRLVARVLPSTEVVAHCEHLGLLPKQIIGMQGPFSHLLNCELYQKYQAEVVVTKNSGEIGGTDTKLSAAAVLGLPVVMIDRPILPYAAVVHTMEEIDKFIKDIEERRKA